MLKDFSFKKSRNRWSEILKNPNINYDSYDFSKLIQITPEEIRKITYWYFASKKDDALKNIFHIILFLHAGLTPSRTLECLKTTELEIFVALDFLEQA